MKSLHLLPVLALLLAGPSFAQPPDTLWTRRYGGANNDAASCVQQTSDGGYILGGWTYSFGAGGEDFWLVKTDANGDSLWSRTFGGSGSDWCSSVQQTSDGGYVLAGCTNSFGAGSLDFWLVKAGRSASIELHPNFLPSEYLLHQNWPNPFNPSTRIAFDLAKASDVTLTVYDLLGREVATLVHGPRPAGTHTVPFDGSGLASGVYLCRLQMGDFAATKKMVLLK